jgi:hypothetical protein
VPCLYILLFLGGFALPFDVFFSQKIKRAAGVISYGSMAHLLLFNFGIGISNSRLQDLHHTYNLP